MNWEDTFQSIPGPMDLLIFSPLSQACVNRKNGNCSFGRITGSSHWVTIGLWNSLYTRSAVSLGLNFHPMALCGMEASVFEVPNFWQASGTQLTFNFTFARLALKVSASLGSYLSSLMGKASKVAAIIQYLPPQPPPIHTHTHTNTHTLVALVF